MFIVFNKSKIKSYLISLGTVVILFGMAFFIMEDSTTITTSASVKELPIYNVASKEKNVAFTMNCAWEADDIDSILEILARHNTHITFFMVGDWVEKNQEAVKKISEAGHEIRKPFRYTSTCE